MHTQTHKVIYDLTSKSVFNYIRLHRKSNIMEIVAVFGLTYSVYQTSLPELNILEQLMIFNGLHQVHFLFLLDYLAVGANYCISHVLVVSTCHVDQFQRYCDVEVDCRLSQTHQYHIVYDRVIIRLYYETVKLSKSLQHFWKTQVKKRIFYSYEELVQLKTRYGIPSSQLNQIITNNRH